MSKVSAQLMRRREYLLELAEAQRRVLAHDIEPWRTPLRMVDRGWAALRYIEKNPAWLIGGAVLLTVFRPVRLVKWLGRGWGVWQIVKQLSELGRSRDQC